MGVCEAKRQCQIQGNNWSFFEKVKESFLLEAKNALLMDEIPSELIISFDQIGINYVPVALWSMEEERA